MASKTIIKIMIAEDHPFFLDGIAGMFRKTPDIKLIGTGRTGVELIEKMEVEQPDVVLMDIGMPVMNGLEATRIITERFPTTHVIVFSGNDNAKIIQLLEAGARGYLAKSAYKQEILDAIRTVYAGAAYYCEHTSKKLKARLASSRFDRDDHFIPVAFTPKELEIIRLICQDFMNHEIAAKLFMSVRTVEYHRQHILDKMKVRNAAAIAVYAIRHGLFEA